MRTAAQPLVVCDNLGSAIDWKFSSDTWSSFDFNLQIQKYTPKRKSA